MMILNEDFFDDVVITDDDIKVNDDNQSDDDFYNASYTLIFPFDFNKDLIKTQSKTTNASEYLDMFERRVEYLIENSNYDFMGVRYQVVSPEMRSYYDDMEVQFLDRKMYSRDNRFYDLNRDMILMYVYVGGASMNNKYSMMKLIVNLNLLFKSFINSPKQVVSGLVFMYDPFLTDAPCLNGYIDNKKDIDNTDILCRDIFCYKSNISRKNKNIVKNLYSVAHDIDNNIKYRDVLHFYKNITHNNDYNSLIPARGWRFKYIGHYCGIDEKLLDQIVKKFPFMYLRTPGLVGNSSVDQCIMKDLLREQCLNRGYRLYFRHTVNSDSCSLDLIFDGTLDIKSYTYTEKVCEMITYTYNMFSGDIEWNEYLSGGKKLSRKKFDEYYDEDYMPERNLFRILTLLCGNDKDKAYKMISQNTE